MLHEKFGYGTIAAIEGNARAAAAIHLRLLPLHKALFLENNPAGVKYAASRLGLARNEFRLPVVPVTPASESAIDAALRHAGLLN